MNLSQIFQRFFLRPYSNWRPNRFFVAAAGSIVTVASLLAVLFHTSVRQTMPVELMGCLTYSMDINIANRFLAISLAMVLLPLLAHLGVFALSLMKEQEDAAIRAVALCFAPLLFFFISIAFSSDPLQREWLFLTTLLYWSALVLFLRESADSNKQGASGIILSGMVLSSYVPAGMAYAAKAGFFYAAPDQLSQISSLLAKFLPPLAVVMPLGIFFWGLLLGSRRNAMWFLLCPVQLGILLSFFSILPAIYSREGEPIALAEMERPFWILVVPLLVLGCCEIFWRTSFSRQIGVSPFSMLALAALFCPIFFGGDAMLVHGNLYETAHRLSPFAALYFDGFKLFKDCMLPYGIWDYFGIWFDAVLRGGPPTYFGLGGYAAIQFFITLFLLGLGLAIFHPAFAVALGILYCGSNAAFIGGLLLAFLLPKFLKRTGLWVGLWLFAASVLPFFRVPQGIFFVVSTGPLFLWQMAVLWSANRKHFGFAVSAFLALAFVFLVWPLEGYFYGLVRIVLETARVNAPWAADTPSYYFAAGFGAFPLVIQILGNGVILLPMFALLAAALVLKFGSDSRLRNREAFALASVVCLYVFCAFSYCFSRLDGGINRQFATLLTLYLPMLATLLYIRSGWRAHAVAITALALLIPVNALSTEFPATPRKLAEEAAMVPPLDSSFIDGEKIGLPALGRGFHPKKEELLEIVAVKEKFDEFLESDETFLNLSNHGIQYLIGRRSPLEHAVYFNFTGDKPQFRALGELEDKKVNAALFGREIFDKSPPSQRTYYFYRYAVLNLLPSEVSENYFIMFHPDAFAKRGVPLPSQEETIGFFERFYSGELEELCAVWGRGYDTFQKRFTNQLDVPLQQISPETVEVRWSEPVDGQSRGLLLLNADQDAGRVHVTWENEFGGEPGLVAFQLRKGWNIVPLDSFPRWLLAKSNQSLKITADEGALKIRSAQLAQRYMPESGEWKIEN